MQDSSLRPENDQAQAMVDDDDEILFAEETEADQPETSWKILIVDDEVEVHDITQLALGDVTFKGRSLTFLSAYSAKEAQQVMRANPDVAVMLLDVVMETEDAGLQLINYVRDDLNNLITRIILRTGQPGQAPEDIVVVNYGIDDYRTKTELTARKLFITVITALRAFSTMLQILEVTQRLQHDLTQEPAMDLGQKQIKVRQLDQALRSLQNYPSLFKSHPILENLNALGIELPLKSKASEFEGSGSEDSDSIRALQTMSMVSRIARMALRIVDGQSTQLGISQTKLAVLMYLSSEPSRSANPSTLAKYCGVSRAAMTGLLDGLTQESYVERANHPSDRRAVMIELTPAGQEFLEQISPQQYQFSELMAALDDTERQTLMELLVKFIDLMGD
jgi:DNA-binding MarR family transcriptional regulator/CheY-like chemotaxis protein